MGYTVPQPITYKVHHMKNKYIESNVTCSLRFNDSSAHVHAMLCIQDVCDKLLKGTRGDHVYIGKFDSRGSLAIRVVSVNGSVLAQRNFENKDQLIGFCTAISEYVNGSVYTL